MSFWCMLTDYKLRKHQNVVHKINGNAHTLPTSGLRISTWSCGILFSVPTNVRITNPSTLSFPFCIWNNEQPSPRREIDHYHSCQLVLLDVSKDLIQWAGRLVKIWDWSSKTPHWSKDISQLCDGWWFLFQFWRHSYDVNGISCIACRWYDSTKIWNRWYLDIWMSCLDFDVMSL